MDSELTNFIKVWITSIACLIYCYYIPSKIPKGMLRLISLLPIFYAFFILPLKLSTIHLVGPTSFFLVWLSTSRLLLFSFDQGPLSSQNKLKLPHFIALTCLPLQIKRVAPKAQIGPNPTLKRTNLTSLNGKSNIHKSRNLIAGLLELVIKLVIIIAIFHSYSYRSYMHSSLVIILLSVHAYLQVELVLVACANLARFLGFEPEPQFNDPHLATSVQDFWGRRWNLVVTATLRLTVYDPLRYYCTRWLGPTLAKLPAVVAAFVVSGLMHEIIFYYFTRVSPTWEVTLFFLLQGVWVAIEKVIKMAVKDTWQMPRVASILLTNIFEMVTGGWLFFPILIRNGVVDKTIEEYFIVENFVKDTLVS